VTTTITASRACRNGTTALSAIADHLSTATAQTARGRRARQLLDEPASIHLDRETSGQNSTTKTWLAELADEERNVWDRLVDELTSSA
jgi:hypothetical protein